MGSPAPAAVAGMENPSLREPPASAPVAAEVAAGTLLACTGLALARAALMAVKDEYIASQLFRLAARSIARNVLEGVALCAIPALVAALAAQRLRRKGRSLVWLALLPAIVLGYLFVSSRLPHRAFYAPALEGMRALAAHAGASVVALVAALCLAPPARTRWRRALALTALVAVLLPSAALRLLPSGTLPDDGRPNVILISIDTLRADRLGCYGYTKPTSPALDRFASEALVFTNAFSPESWTLPAHMSMLTSLYPSSHGVAEERALPRGVPTLASVLSREGYATFAIVDVAYWISPEFGFARGFDSYHVMPDYAEVKIEGILSLLDDLDRRPFFIFAHLYDVHSDKKDVPYEADPVDVETFAGWYDGDFTGCNDRGECASELLYAMVGRQETLSPEDCRVRELPLRRRHPHAGPQARATVRRARATRPSGRLGHLDHRGSR